MMHFNTLYRFGVQPGPTEPALKILLLLTGSISLLSALTDRLFNWLLSSPGPQDWFSLSWWGFSKNYLWQPLTYLFVQYSGYEGFTLYYLVALAVNLYLLWFLGSLVSDRIGVVSFFRFYLATGVISGLAALMVMPLTGGYASLAGPAAPLLGLLVIWTLFNPEGEVLLFTLIPVQVKWLGAAIVALACLTPLSQLSLAYFVLHASGALCGYLYTLLAWNLEGPFAFTHPFDHLVNRIGIQFRKATSRFRKDKNGNKIVDIKTGEPVADDDKFVDQMLAKISRYGEESLSWSEKKRLDQISRKR